MVQPGPNSGPLETAGPVLLRAQSCPPSVMSRKSTSYLKKKKGYRAHTLDRKGFVSVTRLRARAYREVGRPRDFPLLSKNHQAGRRSEKDAVSAQTLCWREGSHLSVCLVCVRDLPPAAGEVTEVAHPGRDLRWEHIPSPGSTQRPHQYLQSREQIPQVAEPLARGFVCTRAGDTGPGPGDQ